MLLAQDIGHIVSAESAGLSGFFNGAGNIFGAILPDQFQQLGDLTGKRAVRISHVAQISLHKNAGAHAIQGIEQALLCL